MLHIPQQITPLLVSQEEGTVAKSTIEAEYRSLSSATADILWLHKLVAELQIPQSTPTII